MKRTIFQFLRLLAFALIYWSFVFSSFIMIRFHAIEEEYGVTVAPELMVSTWKWLDLGVYLGVFVGFFYAIIEFVFDRYLIKNIHLGLSILARTFIYLIILVVSLTWLTYIVEARMDIDLPNDLGWWHTDDLFWLSFGYFTIFSLVFSFIRIAIEKFGKGVFFNMLIGKYRKPVEEDRIFMFLDLKASTTIAERLGHLAYSRLIQDCFLDLNRIIESFEAEVYQYVGDEAVLSWPFKKGIKRNNCITVFFAFQKRIQKRAKYYETKYDVVPEFKAGLHGGRLVVVEVGSVKKELAYHGDVINTTARIQDQCNAYAEKLLVSDALLQHLAIDVLYTARAIGDLVLKGKQSAVKISALHEK